MNLRKIAMGTVACSALLFASCAKSLTYKEALEFVKTHYTHEGDVTAKSGKTKMDFSQSKGDSVRKFLINFFGLNENLVNDSDMTGEQLIQSYLNEATFVADIGSEEEATKANAKFSLKGEELTISESLEGYIVLFVGGECAASSTYNKDGALLRGVVEFKGCTIAGNEGSVSGSISMDYTY